MTIEWEDGGDTLHTRPIEKFQGFVIYKDDNGHFWANGDGFATVEECREDIKAFNQAEENAAYKDNIPLNWPDGTRRRDET